MILTVGTDESGGLGASLYLQEIHGVLAGKIGRVDLGQEKKLHGLMRGVLKLGGVRAVHDVGEGGILWALAEMCFGEGSAGAEVAIPCGKGERVEEALLGRVGADFAGGGRRRSDESRGVSEGGRGGVLSDRKKWRGEFTDFMWGRTGGVECASFMQTLPRGTASGVGGLREISRFSKVLDRSRKVS